MRPLLLFSIALSSCGGIAQSEGDCGVCEAGAFDGIVIPPWADAEPTPGMDATSGMDATTSWTPSMLPGLAVWYDDEVGVGHDHLMPDGLIGWKDKAYNGNLATAVGPGLVIETGVANGHDAFRCNATGLQIAASKTLAWGTNDFWLAVVARWPSDALVTMFARTNEPFALRIAMSSVQVQDGSGNASATTKNFASFHWILAKGRMTSVAIDGFAQPGSLGDWNASALVPIQVCGGTAEIAELIGAQGTLSASDEASLGSYFKAKFNL